MSIERVWSRVQAICRIARLSTSPDETGDVQKMQLQFNPLETRDKISSAQFYGFASSPMAGCQAVIINPSGDAGGGVVMATHDSRYRPKNLKAGEVVVHDNLSQQVYLGSDGAIHITAGHKVQIVCDTEVDVTAPTVNVKASTAVDVNSQTITVSGSTVAINGTTTVTGSVNIVGSLSVNGVGVNVP